MVNEDNLEKANFRKNFIWNILGSTLNGFNSLFFMIIVTRINGLADAGIFTLAFSIACLLCIIGGYAGRIYQVTDVHSQYTDKEYILHKLITSILMMVIAFVYCFIMGYESEKFLIVILLCIVKALEVFGDVFLAILQKKGRLYQSGISLTIKSGLSILTFIIIDLISKSLIAPCLGLIAIWLGVLVLYDIPNALKVIDKNETIQIKKLGRLFVTGFYAFGVLFLSIYLSNAPKYALDGIVSEELQGIFGIVLMPATIVGLCAQYVLQPFLNKISLSYKAGDKPSFSKTINQLALAVIVLGIICLICACVLGIPVLNIIYSLKLNDYVFAFMLIMLGAIFYSLASLYATALTTIRILKSQFIIYVAVSIFGLMISPLLITNFSITGAALSYLLIMLLLCSLYYIMYMITLKNDKGFGEY